MMKKIFSVLVLVSLIGGFHAAGAHAEDARELRKAVLDAIKGEIPPADPTTASHPAVVNQLQRIQPTQPVTQQVVSQPLVATAPPHLSHRQISLDFRGAPVREVLTELSRQAGVNITFPVQADVAKGITVTTLYKGNNIEDAVKAVVTAGNLAYVRDGDVYVVSQFETKVFDLVVLYDSSFTLGAGGGGGGSGSGAAGAAGASSSAAAGGVASSGVGESTFGVEGGLFTGFITKVVDRMKAMMSGDGKISYLPSGLIIVRDYPNVIKDLEKMMDLDKENRKEITLKLTLLRIDYNNDSQVGVNWDAVFTNLSKVPVLNNLQSISLSTTFAGMLTGVNNATLGVVGDFNDLQLTGMMKLLSSYGDINIVHNWQTRAMVGNILPFELTQLAWYTEGSTIQIVNNQTITTPIISSRDVGVKIRLMPMPSYNKEKFLVNTFVELSSVVGSQLVGGQELPSIEKNMVSVPITLKRGDAATISGFKINSETKKRVGLPIINRIPILGTLFGYSEKRDRTSELVVVISIGNE